MKKLILAACALTCATGVFAQGTVQLNNRITGTLVTHIYAPNAGNINLSQIGNGSNDTSSGATSWAGWSLIGSTLSGQYGANTTLATLLGGPTGTQESALTAGSGVTTFRTGGAAGNVVAITGTLNGVAVDAASAVVELVAWDNSSGLYSTWAQASVAWQSGLIAAGKSGALTISAIGGGLNPPPTLSGLQSFNLYFIPEPSTMALAGIGAAAMLIFRRRK